MNRFDASVSAFTSALTRARDMLGLFDALKLMRADPQVCDDALRAAWMQMVSSFDYHNHEIFAIEAAHRHERGIGAKKIFVPLDVLAFKEPLDRQLAFDVHYRSSISYKSFVAYDKIVEAVSCFANDSGVRLEEEFNSTEGDEMKINEIKMTINSIWNRRNKIAHEADINPALAGIELYSIMKDDLVYSITFVERLAVAILNTVATKD